MRNAYSFKYFHFVMEKWSGFDLYKMKAKEAEHRHWWINSWNYSNALLSYLTWQNPNHTLNAQIRTLLGWLNRYLSSCIQWDQIYDAWKGLSQVMPKISRFRLAFNSHKYLVCALGFRYNSNCIPLLIKMYLLLQYFYPKVT